MFEIDYTDPEVRRIVAQYEDLTAQFQLTAGDIVAEHEEQAKAIQDAADARQKASAEFYEQLEKAEKAQLETDETAQSPWTAPREVKDSVMSFGEFDQEERASTWTTPTPPMGFPPPPPIPDPVPEPEVFRGPATQPMMSFGEFEDDDEPVREQPAPPLPPAQPAAQPAPPSTPLRSGRRRLRDDDDDDLSGQSWLS